MVVVVHIFKQVHVDPGSMLGKVTREGKAVETWRAITTIAAGAVSEITRIQSQSSPTFDFLNLGRMGIVTLTWVLNWVHQVACMVPSLSIITN